MNRRSDELQEVVRGLQVSNTRIDKLQEKLLEQGSLEDWLALVNLWQLEVGHLYALGKIFVSERDLEEGADLKITPHPRQIN